jgi:hypothetical protein
VVTTNGSREWGQVICDAGVVGAILDRLMHRAVEFKIKGRSWRGHEHYALGTASRTTTNNPARPA